MSTLGVHFALNFTEVHALKSFETDAERLSYIVETIEDLYFVSHKNLLAQTDKAWDAIHRALGDGSFDYTSGPYPLRLAVLGGEALYGQDDYIMSLKTPKEVADIAEALKLVPRDIFLAKYNAIDEVLYNYPKSKEDFEYSWHWFQELVKFYAVAATENRHVLFTVDQ